MSELSMDIGGVQRLQQRFKALKALDLDDLVAALTAGAFPIMDEAKRRAPFRTGHLRRSITIGTTAKSAEQVAVSVGTNAEYAKYLEFGTGIHAEDGKGRKTPWRYFSSLGHWVTTHGSRAHPYLRPAFDEKRDEAIGEVREALADLLRRTIT